MYFYTCSIRNYFLVNSLVQWTIKHVNIMTNFSLEINKICKYFNPTTSIKQNHFVSKEMSQYIIIYNEKTKKIPSMQNIVTLCAIIPIILIRYK